MTPIWHTAPSGQAYCRNTEDLSISPLGGRQLGLLITITQQPPSCFIHCNTLTKHFQLPLICYIPISRYINDMYMLLSAADKTHNKTLGYTLNNFSFNFTQSKVGKGFLCCIKKQHQHNKFKAADSHHGANSVLSMPKAWRNRGMAQLRALAYYKSLCCSPLPTINKEALVSVCFHENAQIVVRGREQHSALDSKTELRNCCVTTRHVLYVLYCMLLSILCVSGSLIRTEKCVSSMKQPSEWVTTATIPSLSPWNRSLYSCWGIYMFHGGINCKLRGQRSRVQSHSCPTEKHQQTLELNNTAKQSLLQHTYPGAGPEAGPWLARPPTWNQIGAPWCTTRVRRWQVVDLLICWTLLNRPTRYRLRAPGLEPLYEET